MSTIPFTQTPARPAAAAFPWQFFALAFGFTWLVCLPGVLANYGLIPALIPTPLIAVSAQCGASLAGLALTYRAGGKAALAALLRRALDWRIRLPWLLTALLLPLALAAAALGLYALAGGTLPAFDLLAQPLAILPNFVIIFFLMGPVPEEFGWRGYALDRLQARWSALAASLILGLLWAVWHLPTFHLAGSYQAALPFGWFIVQVTASTVLFTWLYNNTHGNLLVALLFHTTINLANLLFPWASVVAQGDHRPFMILGILYVLAAAVVTLVWGPKRLCRGQ